MHKCAHLVKYKEVHRVFARPLTQNNVLKGLSQERRNAGISIKIENHKSDIVVSDFLIYRLQSTAKKS